MRLNDVASRLHLAPATRALIEDNWSIQKLREAQIEEKVTALDIVTYSILQMKEHLKLNILADINCEQALALAG